MTANQKILFQSVAATTARLTAARQGLEDARNLSRAGFASDVVFALHVEAGVQCLAQSERSIPGLPGLTA